MRHYLVGKKIEFKINEQKDQTVAIEMYKDAITKFPEDAAYFTQALGGAYDGILNDQDSYLKYAKKAYELDSTDAVVIDQYNAALIESGMFDDVMTLQNSENYLKNTNKFRQLLNLHYYYYFKKDKQNQLKFLEDSLMVNQFARKAFSYAQFRDIDKLKTIVNKLSTNNKAILFAILKQRDSMYFYLNHEELSDVDAQFPNSRPEMDPYRKEPQYIEFLKKHHFPVNQQKN